MHYKTDDQIQKKVRMIAHEGRKDELLAACDIHHPIKFESQDLAIEFGIHLGWYMSMFFPEDDLWRFTLPEHNYEMLFFIGNRDEVEDLIDEMMETDE